VIVSIGFLHNFIIKVAKKLIKLVKSSDNIASASCLQIMFISHICIYVNVHLAEGIYVLPFPPVYFSAGYLSREVSPIVHIKRHLG